MSVSQSRKVAVRAFATEVADATEQYKESDDERAPNLALLPTDVEANRIFAVGVITDAEDVGSDSEYYHAKVADPTGMFHLYSGQYQPQPTSVIREIESPEYVAFTGKVSRYELEDADEAYNVTIRPEFLTVADSDRRDRWLVETAEATLDRLDDFDASGVAAEVYGEDVSEYRDGVHKVLNETL